LQHRWYVDCHLSAVCFYDKRVDFNFSFSHLIKNVQCLLTASCQKICMTYTVAVCTVLLSGNLYNIYHCCVYNVAVRKNYMSYTIAVCTVLLSENCMSYTIAVCTVLLSGNLYDIFHCCVQYWCQEICMTYTIAVYSVAVRKSV